MNVIQESPITDKFFEYSSNHLCLIDLKGAFIQLNPAWDKISGMDVDLSNVSIFDWIHAKDKMVVRDALATLEEKGGQQSIKFRLAGEGIEPIWLEGTCTIDPATKLIYGCFSDVSGKVKMQEILADTKQLLEKTVNDRTRQLQLINDELSTFAYSVSHDLRAPLRAMVGYSQIIVEDYGDEISEDALNCVQIINDEAKRMGLLIDDLLEFSRMQRKEAFMVEFDMKDLVKQVYKEYKLNHPQPIFEFECENLPRVDGDANMLRHVWSNLLSNAVKYSREDHTNHIKIKYQEKEEEFVFSISDQGVGFDMKYYSKLFGVFQRLHREDEFEGTGIGLALVKKIITRHKGNIWAESVLNEGATFSFTIPKISQNDSFN